MVCTFVFTIDRPFKSVLSFCYGAPTGIPINGQRI